MVDPSNFDSQAEHADLVALEAEIPVLSALRAFTEQAKRAPWFSALGDPHEGVVQDLARAYLDRLGYPDAVAAPLLNWDDAVDAAASLDMNTEGWEVEEQLRAGLVDQAMTSVSEEGMGVMLTHLASQLAPILTDLAEEAIYLYDEAPDRLLDLLVGSAQQAAHGAAWVLAAAAVEAAQGDDIALGEAALDHPLMLKYRLFEEGRWPLVLTGRTLNLF